MLSSTACSRIVAFSLVSCDVYDASPRRKLSVKLRVRSKRNTVLKWRPKHCTCYSYGMTRSWWSKTGTLPLECITESWQDWESSFHREIRMWEWWCKGLLKLSLQCSIMLSSSMGKRSRKHLQNVNNLLTTIWLRMDKSTWIKIFNNICEMITIVPNFK